MPTSRVSLRTRQRRRRRLSRRFYWGCWVVVRGKNGREVKESRIYLHEDSFRVAFYDALTKHKDIGKALDEVKSEMCKQMRR